MTARTIPTAFVHRYLAFSPDNHVDLSGALRTAGIDLETLSDPRARLTSPPSSNPLGRSPTTNCSASDQLRSPAALSG